MRNGVRFWVSKSSSQDISFPSSSTIPIVLQFCEILLEMPWFSIFKTCVCVLNPVVVHIDPAFTGSMTILLSVVALRSQYHIKRLHSRLFESSVQHQPHARTTRHETLIFQGKRNDQEAKDKSEEKQLEDMLIVREFLEVFSEDMSGIPPTRQGFVAALAVLITEASQSRQHDMSEPARRSLTN
nr:hypothetical protein [Tanacetum cinerariifolium]